MEPPQGGGETGRDGPGTSSDRGSPRSSRTPHDPRIGTRVAVFTILSEIGRRGMGIVYLAEHARLGRRVALKLLTPESESVDEIRSGVHVRASPLPRASRVPADAIGR
jgi:serine/threonine protein kinase